jgi:hypothetical protein
MYSDGCWMIIVETDRAFTFLGWACFSFRKRPGGAQMTGIT